MKIAHGTLVMAADGEKVLLFRNEGDEKYPVLETVLHQEQPHAATREQGSDEPGRSFSSTGTQRWHDQDEERFAAHAAELLEKAAAGTEAGIVVVAPPRTLGVLRKHWGRKTRARLLLEIDKDLTHHMTDDLITAIASEPAPAIER